MKQNLRLLYIFCFIATSAMLLSQDKKQLKIADDAYDRLDFLRAFTLYEEIASKDTANMQLVYKMGYCLFAVNKSDSTCLKYFRKAKHKVPEAHFYIGKVYHLEGKEKQALEEYYKFKSLNAKEKEITQDELMHCITTAEIAIKEESHKQGLIVKNLGVQINSSYSDYVPLIWNLNGDLVFTSRRNGSKGGLKDPYGHFYEDIYVAQKSGEGWKAPGPLSEIINTNAHDACVAFSPDGKSLLIYRTDEKQTGGDLYISTYDGSTWSEPVKLGPEINSEYLETSACFSGSGNDIIFASNRPGGLGGKDLYITRKFMNGKYSLPKNLGPDINTTEDEDAPFIDKNNNTLYFSSRGHEGIGEYDIFSCAYDEATDKWAKPENLGMPINSSNDDIYFIKIDNTNNAMFTSRREGGYGDADIYQVNFNESTQTTVYVKFNGDKVTDKANMKELILSLYDEHDGRLVGVYRANKEYHTMIVVAEVDKQFKMIVESHGCEPIIEHRTFKQGEKELTIILHDKIDTGSK